MNDSIERLGHSVIHHGEASNRIYLMKFSWEDQDNIIEKLDRLAGRKGYSKIIAKVPARAQPLFLTGDYQMEASIPGFYNGEEDVFFMAKYFSSSRESKPKDKLNGFFGQLSPPVAKNRESRKLDPGYSISMLNKTHAEEMTGIYRQVFASYPFPIQDPAYLLETMRKGSVIYFGVKKESRLIGLSSAELDRTAKNAEMTDFAVLPECRGEGLAWFLLRQMEKEMAQIGIKTAYTIARLNSPGMNKTFIRSGYQYAGLLVNNTNIAGKIESMNVYYKPMAT
ncbi:MAG: putative beta-lysine N-acetyltransferase [Mangrovibacterium sp.]